MTDTAFWLAGHPARGDETFDVTFPYDGSVIGRTTWANPPQVEAAVAAAEAATGELAATSAHDRSAALRHVAQRLSDGADEVAELITAESGKPLRWAKIEVARAVSTFTFAAEEARRFSGDAQRLDTDAAASGKGALIRRFPYGPVLGITPFNFPLNLVAHKVAPALAVGAPVIVKPAPATPLTALHLGLLLAETELPQGSFSVLPVRNADAGALAADPRLPVVSFTGSETVGWSIREALPRKHVTLELGGNAAALVCADWSTPDDLEWAADRIATFGAYQAGQSCISVQRVFVHDSLYEDFTRRLVSKVSALASGDPREESCVVGPLISVDAAKRVESWVGEAVAAGATLECGGRRTGGLVSPAVLTSVPADSKLATEEVFGPVLTVAPVSSLDEGLAAVNDSRFGLQAGVFTADLRTAFRAHRELNVGGVVIGDVPSFRADQMPYGGNKSSGIGREGLRAAMADYTQERVLVLPDMYR